MLLFWPLRGSKKNSEYLFSSRSLEKQRTCDGNEGVDDIDDDVDDDELDEIVFCLEKKKHNI